MKRSQTAARYDNELEKLKQFEEKDHLDCLFGYLTQEYPLRWGKYGASIKEYPFGFKYPKFCHGPCLAISKSASRKIYQTSLKFDWRDKNLEDVLFNGILREMAKD